MQIGVLGSGNMGAALGTLWAAHHHEVTFSYARTRDKLERLAAAAGNNARAGTPAEATAHADVVLLAVPWHTLDDVLAQAGDLQGKVLLTCSLPMTDDDETLALGLTTSGAEVLAERTGARVVSTFNQIWSDVLTTPARDFSGVRPSLFYCGDANAKRVVLPLLLEAGFDAVDIGELDQARLLEPFGLLMGRLGYRYSPQVAFKFLRR